MSSSPLREIEPSTLQNPNKTALVVDDEFMLRRLVAQKLQANGFLVLEASNGEEALEVASHYQYPIDLLVTDMRMPHVGGADLAIRLHHSRPDICIVFNSGYTECDLEVQQLRLPNSIFIPKPYQLKELMRRIEEIMGREKSGL